MTWELKDKTVVVTGAGKSIGYQIANHFITQGTKIVIVLDINVEQGLAAVANLNSKHGDGKAVFIQCDVTKDLEKVFNKIFDTYKTVDVLVNNAGIVDEAPLSLRSVMEINAIAVMEWSMKFWEHMRTDKGGSGGTILNIGSIYSYTVDPYLPFYKSSKFAVLGFSKTLGHETNFQKFGVRVVVLCPGYTRTGFSNDKVISFDAVKTEYESFIEKQVWQEPDDVGLAAVDVFNKAKSGAAWKVIGGVVDEIPLVSVGDQLR